MENFISGLVGLAVGDALGVPVEFSKQADLDKKPVKDMIGFGTHNQPPGTWSDDSSLAFCLADSLTKGYDLEDIAMQFIAWRTENHWTARGKVFDIGITTMRSINELKKILATDKDKLLSLREHGKESDNGNGSLMRIYPLLLEFIKTDGKKRFEKVWEVSALTHKHIRAAISCYIYLSYLELLGQEESKVQAYLKLRPQVTDFFNGSRIPSEEASQFNRLIVNDIRDLDRREVMSGGYVIETIEASFGSFLTTSTFEEAVLKAVNLGHDTDTTGAVTGGLAGFYYGMDAIPVSYTHLTLPTICSV